MSQEKELRIDKFLWSVRVYKTRSMATDSCKRGRVLINDIPVKPSRTILTGDIIQVRKPPVLYTFKITDIPKSRLGAKLVSDYMDDLTPDEELFKLEVRLSA